MEKSKIRNFSIIAHIDHGKSTLADRMIEICNSVPMREMKAQLLDSMDLERERGITIKLNAIRLNYKNYEFNLIDTPGHVDFTYEVSRSLAASEGAILLVDATQGVQPQTIANTYLAFENNLTVIPVINKVDMQAADVEKTKEQISEILGIDASNAPLISAKNGTNVEEVIQQIIDNIPAPADADDSKPLRALLFDAHYDSFKGIVMLVRVKEGTIKKGDKLTFYRNKKEMEVISVGVNTPKNIVLDELKAGEVGWILTTEKKLTISIIGDTITRFDEFDLIEPLQGYKEQKPMVFSGFYPIDSSLFQQLGTALDKISLSDSSLTYEKESSTALGFGYRLGFLGLLHLEIIQERLEREYNLLLIATAPSVIYEIIKSNGDVLYIQNPSEFPDRSVIDKIKEPYVKLTLFTPQEYVGKLMEYIHERRGIYIDTENISKMINSMIYEIPLGEIVFDFFNSVKSLSKGYASFDYELIGYREGSLVKMDILVNGKAVDALSIIIDKDKAYRIGKDLVGRLKDIIPRHNFEVPVQAAIGNKIISRETIKGYRKDVTSGLYGGDISRKKKLLAKQKKGKKRSKMFGSVEIPQEAYIALLKKDD